MWVGVCVCVCGGGGGGGWGGGGGGGGWGQVDISSQTNATVSEFHLKLLTTNSYTNYDGRFSLAIWFPILLEPY